MFPLLKCKHSGSVLRELQRGCLPNYNEPVRTLYKNVFVEILPKTWNLDAILVGTTESEIKSSRHVFGIAELIGEYLGRLE
ncbi:hypothetical protein T10_10833 [Trichinella papuae]|uniref:Uncharacterized protein n=1 Tax=Trichinella papuae TaxID=268474 RepID=A0A0V1M0J6_9BILA|nr:hypothetical protein T10_10833 [Trichinella papuae]